jgi:phosphopantothenoylcysteine synthetase/decarboxylase
VVDYAKKKLTEKKMDWIVANKVGEPGAGFAADTNEVILIAADGSSAKLGPTSKAAIAKELIQLVTPISS